MVVLDGTGSPYPESSVAHVPEQQTDGNASPALEATMTPLKARSLWFMPTTAALTVFVGMELSFAFPAAWFYAVADMLRPDPGGLARGLVFWISHWSLVNGHVATPISLAVYVLLFAWLTPAARFWKGFGFVCGVEAVLLTLALLLVGLFPRTDDALKDLKDSAAAAADAFTHEPWWPWWPFAFAVLVALLIRVWRMRATH